MLKEETIELERACAFCEHAVPLVDVSRMLCEKKGVVASEFLCRRFVYDPLKRTPQLPPKLIIPPPEDLLP